MRAELRGFGNCVRQQNYPILFATRQTSRVKTPFAGHLLMKRMHFWRRRGGLARALLDFLGPLPQAKGGGSKEVFGLTLEF